MIEKCYVNEGNQPWKKFVLDFDVEELTKALLANKDVFAQNKGRGRIEINESKAGNLYARIDTYIKPKVEEVPVKEHLSSREDDGLAF